jgi:hypothetical protein
MRLFGFAFAAVLSLSAIGCGSTNPCEQALDKIKSCYAAKDCTKLTGVDQTACQLEKDTIAKSAVQGSCDGQNATAANTINNCTLDSTTCGCK